MRELRPTWQPDWLSPVESPLDVPPSRGALGEPDVPEEPEEPDEPPHSAIGVCVQPVVGEQVSVVHGSPSSQLPQLLQVAAPGSDA